MNLNKQINYPLAVVYIAIVGLVIFKVYTDSSLYTTPDSLAYLAQAEFILSTDFTVLKGDFTTWPIGYPFMIAVFSRVLDLSVLYASKLVNFFFLIGVFFFLNKWFKHRAWFVALVFCSYTALEVVAFSWSETMFFFFVLLFIESLREVNGRSMFLSAFLLMFSLEGLFLTKYLGAVFFLFAFLFILRRLSKGIIKESLNYLLGYLIASVCAIIYFIHNHAINGFLTGETRFVDQKASFFERLVIVSKGLINELFLARKLYSIEFDLLFFVLLAVQCVVIYLVLTHRISSGVKRVKSNLSNLLIIVSGFYLMCLVFLRFNIPLYDFDFRLLSPFSLLFLIGLAVSYTQNERWYKKTKKYVVFFFLLSYLMNLPKTFILEYLGLI